MTNRKPINPIHLNGEFDRLVRVIVRHISNPADVTYAMLKDEFDTYLMSWAPLVTDSEPLTSKIEVFRALVVMLDPNAGPEAIRDFTRKFTDRRRVAGETDGHLMHIEAIILRPKRDEMAYS